MSFIMHTRSYSIWRLIWESRLVINSNGSAYTHGKAMHTATWIPTGAMVWCLHGIPLWYTACKGTYHAYRGLDTLYYIVTAAVPELVPPPPQILTSHLGIIRVSQPGPIVAGRNVTFYSRDGKMISTYLPKMLGIRQAERSTTFSLSRT